MTDSIPLFTDHWGKLQMAFMFLGAGREELANQLLREICDAADIGRPLPQE